MVLDLQGFDMNVGQNTDCWAFTDDVPTRPWPHDYPREELVFIAMRDEDRTIKYRMTADDARQFAKELLSCADHCDEQNEVWQDIGEGK